MVFVLLAWEKFNLDNSEELKGKERYLGICKNESAIVWWLVQFEDQRGEVKTDLRVLTQKIVTWENYCSQIKGVENEVGNSMVMRRLVGFSTSIIVFLDMFRGNAFARRQVSEP